MINFILGIGIICFTIFYYFLETDVLKTSPNILTLLFALMFLLYGIENTTNGNRKYAYFYIIVGGVVLLGLLINTIRYM